MISYSIYKNITGSTKGGIPIILKAPVVMTVKKIGGAFDPASFKMLSCSNS
jgi:hypothetical protein